MVLVTEVERNHWTGEAAKKTQIQKHTNTKVRYCKISSSLDNYIDILRISLQNTFLISREFGSLQSSLTIEHLVHYRSAPEQKKLYPKYYLTMENPVHYR